MIDVVVIIDEKTKNKYFLSPNSLSLKVNDYVIFETDNGLLMGRVCKETYKEKSNNLILPLNKVLRLSTVEDKDKYYENKKISEDALLYVKKISKTMDLEMNFIDAYLTFDNSQFIFSFLSDNRIDFRDLAKKLAAKYKTRIELRQVGVRDKAKKIGGLGPCGLFLCCNSFLTDFNSVSINMAKNQMLALNPSKINGICGVWVMKMIFILI
jgi:cell fate regulator YaaT (PSP1 superfamily)